MRLLKLSIKNFKGIGSFSFEPDGNNADVFGTNEVGKTTIMDAYTWLLTNKDSQNATSFSIKPIGGLKKDAFVEVEGVFDVDGKTITLKKVYKEDWTKKRGQARAEFTGHVTDYFVNDVPAKLRGYTEKIKEIADPDLFRTLTNLRYVNEEMKWQPRRALLLEVCGDVSDEDAIATSSEFKRIPEMIGDKTSDEYRLEVEYKRKGINGELKSIPVRIDELQKSLPDDRTDTSALDGRKTEIDSRLSVLRNELSMVESGGAAGKKQVEIQEVENQIRGHEAEARKKTGDALAKKRDIEKFCLETLSEKQSYLRKLKREFQELREDGTQMDAVCISLRNEWWAKNKETFDMGDSCPTCGQEIPEELREEAKAKFNNAKAEELTEINDKGKAKKDELEALGEKLKRAESALSVAEADVETHQKDYDQAKTAAIKAEIIICKSQTGANNDELKKLESKYESHAHKKPDFTIPAPTDEHQDLINQKAKLESELSELQAGTRDETSGRYAEISELEAEQKDINEKLAAVESDKKTRLRITELGSKEKQLAAEFESLEADLQLLEDFTRAKCDLLTDRINSKFKLVKWQLFEDQINGGLKDVCTATIDGVPYPDLNNAAKINAGIDIINALSEFYGVRMPLFIDNAESIVEPHPTGSQMLRLVVSAKNKRLKVVAHDQEAEV